MRSPRSLLLASLLLGAGTLSNSKAVETVVNGSATYNTNNNIGSSVFGWSSGWGTGNTNTGWNYVGTVSDASGVYLGNGWVLTAAHVNSPNTFTLAGNTYTNTGVYYSNFTNSASGTTNADITLFQISTISLTGTNLSLSSLTITSAAPTGKVVMIGYGGPSGQGSESWGTNSVYLNNYGPVSVNGFESIDFVTFDSGSNYATLVNGDSGGGDFVRVGTNWELAGLNEAVSTNAAFFVQLSSYSSQINAIIAVPEPQTVALLLVGALLMIAILRRRSAG